VRVSDNPAPSQSPHDCVSALLPRGRLYIRFCWGGKKTHTHTHTCIIIPRILCMCLSVRINASPSTTYGVMVHAAGCRCRCGRKTIKLWLICHGLVPTTTTGVGKYDESYNNNSSSDIQRIITGRHLNLSFDCYRWQGNGVDVLRYKRIILLTGVRDKV